MAGNGRAMLAASLGVAAVGIIAGSVMTTVPSASAQQQSVQSVQSQSAVTQGIQQLRQLGVSNISVLDASSGQVTSHDVTPNFRFPGP